MKTETKAIRSITCIEAEIKAKSNAHDIIDAHVHFRTQTHTAYTQHTHTHTHTAHTQHTQPKSTAEIHSEERCRYP